MMFSKSSECALRAMIYIAAQKPGTPVLSRDVAEYLGMPIQCMTKIMRGLAKRGLLESLKGRGGGFVLTRNADSLSILDVVEAVEGRLTPHCLLGLKVCADETACPVHCQWAQLRGQEMEVLRHQSIGAMAQMLFASPVHVA